MLPTDASYSAAALVIDNRPLTTTRRLAFAALALIMTACQSAPSSTPPMSGGLTQADRDAIASAAQDLAAATVAKDGVARATLYTMEAIFMPPDAPAVEGRATLAAYWNETWSAMPQFLSLDIRQLEVQGGGEWAYAHGTYRFTTAEEESLGKFIEIWKKQPDGSWLLHRDIFNSDAGS